MHETSNFKEVHTFYDIFIWLSKHLNNYLNQTPASNLLHGLQLTKMLLV